MLCLAALVAGPVLAEDKKPDVKKEEPKKPDVKKEEPKKPDVKKEEPKPDPNAALFTFDKRIKADEKQVEALAALKKEYLPQLQELDKKVAGILTADRIKARDEAVKKAKDDGKKGAELAKAGQEALKLTEDESKVLQARNKLRGEVNKKKTELLTEEQKKALQPKPKTTK